MDRECSVVAAASTGLPENASLVRQQCNLCMRIGREGSEAGTGWQREAMQGEAAEGGGGVQTQYTLNARLNLKTQFGPTAPPPSAVL